MYSARSGCEEQSGGPRPNSVDQNQEGFLDFATGRARQRHEEKASGRSARNDAWMRNVAAPMQLTIAGPFVERDR